MDTNISEKEQIWEGTPRNCSETRRQHEKPFFEMSRVVESPEMLKSWVEWFRRLHIPCAIAKTDGGYTLWRKGTEVGRRRSKTPSVLIKKNNAGGSPVAFSDRPWPFVRSIAPDRLACFRTRDLAAGRQDRWKRAGQAHEGDSSEAIG